jgi:hypothetical protein
MVVDGELETRAPEAVGPDHEAPVPVVRDLGPEARTRVDAPEGGRSWQRRERELRLVHEVRGRCHWASSRFRTSSLFHSSIGT